jgi:hypothetical protein
MGLFDSIFRELDSIITTLDHSASQFDFTSTGEVPKNVVTPVEAEQSLDKLNKNIDTVLNVQKKLFKKK